MHYLFLALVFAVPVFAQQSADSAGTCGSRPWVNAFHPEKAVVPDKADACPPDLKRPLFTREGTLACPTEEIYDVAFNSMMQGWHYAPTAGVKPRKGETTGMRVSPEHFGCAIHHDGVPAKSTGSLYGMVRSSIGWVRINNLRN